MFALATFGYASAQSSDFGFSKGNKFLEGSLSFGSDKSSSKFEGEVIEEEANTSIGFTPKFGYFVSDKLAIGANLSIQSSKRLETEDGSEDDERKSNTLGAGIFARYYFFEIGQRFKTYTEFGVGFSSNKSSRNGVDRDPTTTLGAGLTLGFNYFVTPKLAISMGLANILSFSSSTTKVENVDAKTNNTSFRAELNVFQNFLNTSNFGLLYKF